MGSRISTVFMAAALVALATAGCSKSHSNGNGSTKPLLAAINAAPDMPDVTFLRVEEVWQSMAFTSGTSYRSVDPDTYTINFDSLLPGDQTNSCQGDVNKNGTKDANECTRVATESINVVNGHEYLAALTGKYGALSIHVYDDTPHVFNTVATTTTPIDTNLQVQIFNWSNALGAVDVYLEPPGTNLSVTQVKATLQPGDEYNGLIATAGDYVLTITPPNNPNAPIYTSDDVTLSEQTRVGFGIYDGTSDTTSAVRVTRFRDQGGDLLDRRQPTLMRAANVSPAVGTVDVYAQEDYTHPIYSALALNQETPYVTLDPTWLTLLELDVTPTGNVGVLLKRDELTFTKGQRSTYFLAQTSTGAFNGLTGIDQTRRLAPYAQLRAVNSFGSNLDFYIIPHGNNVFTSTINESLSTASVGASQQFAPGAFDIIIAKSGTDTFVYGPQQVTLAGSGIYTIVAVPTDQASRANVLLLDDFAQ
ncbi:MAG TPA: DUF4397 domain-containing protein [Gammaproteobacteria bacterium]|nr:DUF4397 domain-containing protein [Gammaproteobacteria bacterium]